MSSEFKAFLASEEQFDATAGTQARRLDWEFYTSGSEESQKVSQDANVTVRQHFSDPERFRLVDGWKATNVAENALEARQLELLWREYLSNQQDRESLKEFTKLEAEQAGLFNRFRADLSGRACSENDLNEILASSTDSEEVRAAWEAAKQIGSHAAGRAMRMVQLRNEAARKQGFADAFAKGLALGDLTEARLFGLLDELAAATEQPYRNAKATLDAQLAQRFSVSEGDLRPWHYGDPFFQSPPRSSAPQIDPYFSGRDLAAMAVTTLDTVGLDVRQILTRSDLFPREGKNQHAFCTYIAPDGADVRVLCNLNDTYHWMSVLLHELGHALHWEYRNKSVPPMLVHPPHGLVAETESQLLERVAATAPWLEQVVGLPASEASSVALAMQESEHFAALIMARWSLVMAHFERAMFKTPEADLSTLWWDLVERFQLVHRPDARHAPDWAAKIHLANFPGSYYVYILGELAVSQMASAMRRDLGDFFGNPKAGPYLMQNLYQLGSVENWEATVRRATGSTLSTAAFVAEHA